MPSRSTAHFDLSGVTGPVLVTGANGFVGRHLVAELERSGVRLADRGGREIGPETDWTGAFEDVGAVVHLAALAHDRATKHEVSGDYEALRRVNALGTERLARAAAAMGVRRFVFLSTIGVCGDETSGAPLTEESPQAPRSLYAASKAEAERLLHEISRETGLLVTVLRPTLVYGPENGGNMLRLLRVIDHGWPLPLAAVDNRRSLTFVGNLVSAIAAVLGGPERSATFVVCDSVALSTPHMIRGLAAGMERGVALFPLPVPLLRAAARLAGRQDEIRRLTGSLVADCGKLSSDLAWRPPFDAEASLYETGRWFRSEYRTRRSG
jgi:UDP-glucose 4-epimerase